VPRDTHAHHGTQQRTAAPTCACVLSHSVAHARPTGGASRVPLRADRRRAIAQLSRRSKRRRADSGRGGRCAHALRGLAHRARRLLSTPSTIAQERRSSRPQSRRRRSRAHPYTPHQRRLVRATEPGLPRPKVPVYTRALNASSAAHTEERNSSRPQSRRRRSRAHYSECYIATLRRVVV
jgi:hypothetical protein